MTWTSRSKDASLFVTAKVLHLVAVQHIEPRHVARTTRPMLRVTVR